MKRFLEKYKPNKFKPVLYKFIRRFVIGMVLALLWDRFFNIQKRFAMTEHVFFVLGALFFAIAWVNYLKIDGMRIHYPGKKPAPEESDDSDSADPNEDTKTALISNLLAGLSFMLPSLFSLIRILA